MTDTNFEYQEVNHIRDFAHSEDQILVNEVEEDDVANQVEENDGGEVAVEGCLTDDCSYVDIQIRDGKLGRVVEEVDSILHFFHCIELPSYPAQVSDSHPSKAFDVLYQHHDSMWHIYKVEQKHENEGCKLEVLNLTCKPSCPVDVVIYSHTNHHRHYNQVNGLGNIAFVHCGNNLVSLCIIFLQWHN